MCTDLAVRVYFVAEAHSRSFLSDEARQSIVHHRLPNWPDDLTNYPGSTPGAVEKLVTACLPFDTGVA